MYGPKHFENLDALRFVAFLFIFFGHALDTPSSVLKATESYQFIKEHIYTLGKTGFSFAFVLSSYINTWVMLTERQMAQGYFNPWHFYIRRALRIWPLYFLTLFIGFVVIPYLFSVAGAAYHEPAEPLWFVTFLGNFYLIGHGFSHSPILSVLWSVSVEEQFYLVWPMILMAFGWRLKWLFPLLIAVFLAATWYYYGSGVNLFFHTLFLLADIAVGAAFAFVSFKRGPIFKRLVDLKTSHIAVLYVVFALSLLFYQEIFNGHIIPEPFSLMVEKLWFAVILGLIIFEQNFSSLSLLKFGSFKGLTWLGTISYGLFCFHEIGLLAGQKIIGYIHRDDAGLWALGVKPALAFMVILPMAYASWKWFELPFLQLKRYFYSKNE